MIQRSVNGVGARGGGALVLKTKSHNCAYKIAKNEAKVVKTSTKIAVYQQSVLKYRQRASQNGGRGTNCGLYATYLKAD